MRWTFIAGAALVLVAHAAEGVPGDRLTRFAELGRLVSGGAETPTELDAEAALAELFALADDEIVENLTSGEPFASVAFLQERLDAFMATWGGAGFRVQRVGRPGAGAPLTIGLFTVPGPAPRGSVRVYGRRADGAIARLAAIAHEGTPDLHPWPSARDGAPQFAASWLGAGSGLGGRPFDVEIWRRGGREGVERMWSLAAVSPEGVDALGFSIKAGEIAIRHEPRYPGWKPGCPGQTEQTDLYRLDPRRGVPTLAGRHVVNGWHRELQAAVDRLLSALAAGRTAAVADLVPDRALRARLPAALAREPACDQVDGRTPPAVVVVAATEDRGAAMVPWSLTWRRAPKGWRLSAATPVLQ